MTLTMWLTVLLFGLLVTYRLLSMVYPRDPRPVPPGVIQDAVIIYTWAEALSHNARLLRLWYVTILVALMFSVA